MTRVAGDHWLNPEDVQMPAGLPTPQLWRMLVAPVQPSSMSKGGIALPDMAQDNMAYLTFIGKVMACGPLVGKKPEWPAGSYDIKEGDWVVFGQHGGMRFEFQGVKLLLLDDDAVLAKATGPDGFRVYI